MFFFKKNIIFSSFRFVDDYSNMLMKCFRYIDISTPLSINYTAKVIFNYLIFFPISGPDYISYILINTVIGLEDQFLGGKVMSTTLTYGVQQPDKFNPHK